MKTSFFSISLAIIIHGLQLSVCAQEDTTCIVNGFVYEVDESRPMADVNVRWYRFDSLGTIIDIDSVFTDAEGRFADTITKGIYSFYTQLEHYRNYEYHQNLELTDSSYSLEFAVYHPVISVSHDSLLIHVNREEPVQREIIVQNAGTGKLSYNYILYLREEIPDDLTLLNEGGVCGSVPEVYYGAPSESDWKYLVQDRQDQDSGQHDIKSVQTQMIEGTFYLKIDFYDTLGTFSNLNVEFWLDSDPAENTGHPDVGFEYLIYINGESGMLMAPLLDYANGYYNALSDPVYADIQEENDYLIVGYPRMFLCQYEIILSTAYTRGGSGDLFYSDYAPDWGTGNILFSVKSNPSLELDAYYGEADESAADTIILTVDPGIVNDTLDNFFIGIVSEDEATPITVIPVQLQKPHIVDKINEISAYYDFTLYPNPAMSDISIHYALNKTADVTMQIYDLQGRQIKTLFTGIQAQGEYTVNWSITDDLGIRVIPGIYFCELLIDGNMVQKKLIIL